MLPHLRVRSAIWLALHTTTRRLWTGKGRVSECVDSVNTPRNAVNAPLSLFASNPCKLSCSCPRSV